MTLRARSIATLGLSPAPLQASFIAVEGLHALDVVQVQPAVSTYAPPAQAGGGGIRGGGGGFWIVFPDPDKLVAAQPWLPIEDDDPSREWIAALAREMALKSALASAAKIVPVLPAQRTVYTSMTTEQVLAAVARAASAGRLSPTVRAWAILAIGTAVSEEDRAFALARAVRSSLTPVRNPVGAQRLSGLDALAMTPAGSCTDYSTKLASALLSIGIQTAVVGQSSRADGEVDHVLVAAWVAGRWLRLDAYDSTVALGSSRQAKRELWVSLPDCAIMFDSRSVPPKVTAPRRVDVVAVGDVPIDVAPLAVVRSLSDDDLARLAPLDDLASPSSVAAPVLLPAAPSRLLSLVLGIGLGVGLGLLLAYYLKGKRPDVAGLESL